MRKQRLNSDDTILKGVCESADVVVNHSGPVHARAHTHTHAHTRTHIRSHTLTLVRWVLGDRSPIAPRRPEAVAAEAATAGSSGRCCRISETLARRAWAGLVVAGGVLWGKEGNKRGRRRLMDHTDIFVAGL